MNLAERIEPDAHRLFMELMTSDKHLICYADSVEYAEGVMTILEGLYPGARDRITFTIP